MHVTPAQGDKLAEGDGDPVRVNPPYPAEPTIEQENHIYLPVISTAPVPFSAKLVGYDEHRAIVEIYFAGSAADFDRVTIPLERNDQRLCASIIMLWHT